MEIVYSVYYMEIVNPVQIVKSKRQIYTNMLVSKFMSSLLPQKLRAGLEQCW